MPIRQQMKESSILYIEDDAITRKNLSQFLKSQCKDLYVAGDGQEGFELYQRYGPDIVITDIEMPMLNGLEMAKKIRQISLSTQIIIITAHKKPEYLLEAINLQLVQYIIKPINLEKITNVLELTAKYLHGKVLSSKSYLSNEIYYDSYTKELVANAQVVNLSKYERALIELLIKKYPAPISYDHIDAHIYSYGASKNAIKLLVSSLRDKIQKQAIINVSGFGYKLKLMDTK